MEYNKCNFCGADNGRCVLMTCTKYTNNKAACMNCHDTLKTGNIVIHTNLRRTDKEIKKTISLISK